MKRFLTFWCVFLLSSSAQAEEKLFHPPHTGAEKALNLILEADNKQSNLFLRLFQELPFYDPQVAKKYMTLFTPALLDTLRGAEKKAVLTNCGGVYKNGEICGIDYSVLSCSQDNGDGPYLFYTITSSETDAVLAYSYPPYERSSLSFPHHHMVKNGNFWQLDGINCGDLGKYNMK